MIKKTYSVRYSDRLDVMSGNLMKDFTFPWKRGRAPRTEFRAVWNEQALGFHFDVDDEEIILNDSEDPTEAVLGSDRVEIFLATKPDLKGPYYGAEMDPRGNVYDYKAKYHREFDDRWSFGNLKFRCEIREGGYSVKGRFAMDELNNLDLVKGKQLIAGVYRAEFGHNKRGDFVENWISWVNPQKDEVDFHVPESFGTWKLDL
ncbi:MAG: hypothetical protein MI807_02010 [Verrucomicrobiales bacterium]|nr:hypothetical protein [Verrucomicrobiales bacterium]